MNRHLNLPALRMTCWALILATAGTAYADFSGQSVTAEWRYPGFGSVLESHVVVVGPGVELPADAIVNDFKFSIDVGGDHVQFDFNSTSHWLDEAFNGWYFSDTNGTVPDIVGYSIDSVSSGVSGLTNDALFFDANAVWGNFRGVQVAGAGDYIRLKVSFIPEPGSTVLAFLGLGSLALVRRIRRQDS